MPVVGKHSMGLVLLSIFSIITEKCAVTHLLELAAAQDL